MKDVYEFCPQFENEKYLLRLIEEKDKRIEVLEMLVTALRSQK